MTTTFTPVPRKYASPLFKKLAKLERKYDKAVGKPLMGTRILRATAAIAKKLEIKEEEKD